MLAIYLNRVAVWKPVAVDGMDKRPTQENVSYLTKDSLVFKQSRGCLFRFVKNYKATLDDKTIDFSLFVRTDRTDDNKIEKELDKIAKELNYEYIENSLKGADFINFNYTDKYINEKKVEV